MRYKVWALVLISIAVLCFMGLALLMCTNFFPWEARIMESTVLSGTGLFSLFLLVFIWRDVLPITRQNAEEYTKYVILRNMNTLKFLVCNGSRLTYTDLPSEATRYKREAAPLHIPGVDGKLVIIPVDN